MASTSNRNFSSFFSPNMTNISIDEKIRIALQFNNLSKSTKETLTKVYCALSIGITVATIGVLFSMFIYRPNFLVNLLLVIGSSILFATAPRTQRYEHQVRRFALFNLVTFVTGISSSGLIEFYMDINPAIVLNAFIATSGIFISFTLFSLFTDKRLYIFIGSGLASLTLGIFVLSLTSLFTGYNETLDQFLVIAILATSVLFVIFDTQLMVHRIENMGEKDVLLHAFILFYDFVDLFRIILKILAKKENKNNNKSRR
ncbi:hypothetical protein RB653_008212 [Dictyostelium firmibasis]|uniref:Bax inhibitor 1 n=1 Tax=Dictyostelium firmibasis TaxID=79012 RepID=A0AAN7YZL1_9MYCE